MASKPKNLAAVRQAITETQAELAAQEYLPSSREERHRAIVAAIDGEARRFAGGRSLETLPYARSAHEVQLDRVLPAPDREFSSERTFHAAMCHFFGDQLKAKLLAISDNLEDGPSLEEVERRTAELTTRLRDLEIQEEFLIRAGEEEGQVIARRADADPALVLAP